MDILKRSLAPITAEAWEEIDAQARNILTPNLSCRRFLDVHGPKGIAHTVKPLGKLDVPGGQKKDAVNYGVYKVRPLVEARVGFQLDVWDLDNVVRGSRDVDFSSLEEAALKIARFEEEALYNGFAPGGIEGLKKITEDNTVPLKTDSESSILEAVSLAVQRMRRNGVGGPYALVASEKLFLALNGKAQGYPLGKRIKDLTEGEILRNPSVPESYLVSLRGGDMALDLGLDLSIGFASHNARTVELFFTESFTFSAAEPRAALRFV